MKKTILPFLFYFFITSLVYCQSVSVITNDKNPFIHAFSMHNLPFLTAINQNGLNNNTQKPFYELVTIFGDGQFSKDSIFAGPKKDGNHHFSSPINYTSHLYPSSSNYPILVILKARNTNFENEILINDLTIPNKALINDHGMCHTSSSVTLNKDEKIEINTLKLAIDSSDYQCIAIRFLSHSKSSNISLSFDQKAFFPVGQSIPNIVGAIKKNTSLSQLGKTVYSIGKIPRFAQFEPQELVIYNVFQSLNNSIKPSLFKVEYLDQNNHLLAVDSIQSNFSDYNNTKIQLQNQPDNVKSSPKRKRFSDMSILQLLLNNWSVILVGILVILFLIYLIRKYKPF